MSVVLDHARDFVNKRLASAPMNDGRQTPWRGHPVFVAQHATATCCRGCLAKWHPIDRWMWFVFPQLAGLGHSSMAVRFSIGSIEEARAYIQHPILGPRLVECACAVLGVNGKSARDIFGAPDDLKLRSAATLFAQVSPPDSVFHQIID